VPIEQIIKALEKLAADLQGNAPPAAATLIRLTRELAAHIEELEQAI